MVHLLLVQPLKRFWSKIATYISVHPLSNGLSEGAVQTFKQSLHQIPESSVREK